MIHDAEHNPVAGMNRHIEKDEELSIPIDSSLAWLFAAMYYKPLSAGKIKAKLQRFKRLGNCYALKVKKCITKFRPANLDIAIGQRT